VTPAATASTTPAARTVRTRAAVAAMTAANRLSRALGRGAGTVAGGRVGLAVDPDLLRSLSAGRRVALVSGTNGKTTTTRLLAAVLAGPGGADPVVSNDTGANMPAGHVAALAEGPAGAPVVLEVDEGYLGLCIERTAPEVVVLLNLSRDQLDRISEVRMLAERWRTALGGLEAPAPGRPGTVVVANADDPMVAWAALAAPEVRWVGAGQVWRDDAVGCPACGGRITFDEASWRCDRCDLARPAPDAALDGDALVVAGVRHPIAIALPGRFNRANAAMVAVAGAGLLAGADPVGEALRRMARVDEVAGRFSTVVRSGRPVRLLLAKNPAGWTAIFDLLDEDGPTVAGPAAAAPLVLSVNARVADGKDTSWLWDVPFERLRGREVVATGERRLDLAVRLRYAEVDHVTVADPVDAVDHAVARAAVGVPADRGAVQFLGNYTAFADLRRAL
jgi:UDP-N-acetylmuramyl tripeptide synthase